MWLPVEFSFSRNDTVAAIKAGKYTNIRGIFAPSADSNAASDSWMTATQAIAKPGASKPTPYALFDMGATCWYMVGHLYVNLWLLGHLVLTRNLFFFFVCE